MDKYTKAYLDKKRGVSKEGIPNRKGGSWPNHPSMRYELPIPFSPGADNVTEDYRRGWTDTFGPQADISARFCPKCDKTWSWCECKTDDPGSANGRRSGSEPEGRGSNPCPGTKLPRPKCSACGQEGEHRVAPGILACEN